MKHVFAAMLLCSLALLSGCAMVKAKTQKPAQYVDAIRSDVLSTGELSAAARETLLSGGIEQKPCQEKVALCTARLDFILQEDVERRLSAESELWLAEAMKLAGDRNTRGSDVEASAWLESARYAYAYLFFSARKPGERAFENRQTQVRDYYNYAVQQVVRLLFQRWRGHVGDDFSIGLWNLRSDMHGYRLPGGAPMPLDVIPASSLRLDGIRSVYRRDGFGAELVTEVSPLDVGAPSSTTDVEVPTSTPLVRKRVELASFSEIPFAPTTVLLQFDGDTLEQVLDTHSARVRAFDPNRSDAIDIDGERVPLAANFTAASGLWLARSGFATQSLRSLLGKAHGIDAAHLYLMQPFDPDKRVIVLLHGLASSPEAWVNVANEILGDEQLRAHYQIWQVYYPTNLPIAVNRSELDNLIEQTLQHFDPKGTSSASQHMVLIGHSMGGLIARLLVSDSGESVWNSLMADRKLSGERGVRVRATLGPLLHFKPLPQVDRAIFVAAPHRGTPLAGGRIARFVAGLIKLPFTLLENFGEAMRDLAGDDDATGKAGSTSVPNSIDNLRDTDPFIKATTDLPISPQVKYHSIIGDDSKPGTALEDSSDGVVPYKSAHLDGAQSELVLRSWHDVQQNPKAILEMRRILHEQIAAESAQP